jgi:hypothetical protein
VNPFKAIRSGVRFARAQKEAFDVWRLAEKAEHNPALYRDPGFSQQLLKECRELFAVLPIPQETRHMVQGLSGYKTYLVAAATAALTAAKMLGYIDDASYQNLMLLLGAGGLATVRAAIAKTEKPTDGRG